MDKDIRQQFGRKTSHTSSKTSEKHPFLVEMVKLLARISAENDYNSHIAKHNKPARHTKKRPLKR